MVNDWLANAYEGMSRRQFLARMSTAGISLAGFATASSSVAPFEEEKNLLYYQSRQYKSNIIYEERKFLKHLCRRYPDRSDWLKGYIFCEHPHRYYRCYGAFYPPTQPEKWESSGEGEHHLRMVLAAGQLKSPA